MHLPYALRQGQRLTSPQYALRVFLPAFLGTIFVTSLLAQPFLGTLSAIPLCVGRYTLMFDAMLSQLETDLRTALGTCVTGLVATARVQLEQAHADLIKERTQMLIEVAEERATALAEVDARRAELGCEIAVMHKHKEAQEGRVKLNIGGYQFETSVQTLRRLLQRSVCAGCLR
jgi:hypothetical protein